MAVLAIIVALVFLVTFAATPTVGGGWFWDFGNALGFVALAGLIFQMIPYARTGTTQRHERLGYWVLGIGTLHAFWFLTGDGAVWAYLSPGAPLYMWLGLAAILALAVLTALARMPDRMRVHRRFRTFRFVHRVLGFAVVGTAGLHVVLTGFYLSRSIQIVLLALIFAATCLGRPYWGRLGRPPVASGPAYAVLGLGAAAAFLLIRNLTW